MKLSKQHVGLIIVLGAGLCALGVDHFLLRPDGGLSSAAAAVVNSVDQGLLGTSPKVALKEVVDRSSAAIADRLERLPVEAVTVKRDAFVEPWSGAPQQVQAGESLEPVGTTPIVKDAPWTLTSVSSIGGRIAVVLNRDIVLTVGVNTRTDVELIDASSQVKQPWAVVKDTATGEKYLLVLNASDAAAKH